MSRGDKSVYPSAGDEFVDHPVHGHTTKASLGMEGPAGITIREHFAGLAMQGLLANEPPDQEWNVDICARRAVNHADALLKALELYA